MLEKLEVQAMQPVYPRDLRPWQAKKPEATDYRKPQETAEDSFV